MNPFKDFAAAVDRAVEAAIAQGVLPPGTDTARVVVEPPREPALGDFATNAAMVLAKPAGLKPRELAERLAQSLRAEPQVVAVEVAGPGFINVRLDPAFWQQRLKDVLVAGTTYGASTIGAGRPVNVEFVSANPTGPLHAAHARGAVVGDALAGLLEKAGYSVMREYYINDAGAQVDVLARSAYLRYREALGEAIGEIPAGLYPGEYLKDVGQALAARDGERWLNAAESEWLPVVRDFAIDTIMAGIRQDLAALGVHMDVFTSERALIRDGKVDEAMAMLQEAGHLYVGVLEPPKGKTPDDWEPRPQTLFRSTAFGDDVDRPVKKYDGSWTYFASDVAYHHEKFRRGFPVMIDVWGADHGGYVKRMQAATRAITGGKGKLDVKLCQLVSIYQGGKPVKMSKRAGTFVTLADVLEEVGRDVTRFSMMTRRNDQTLDFDFDKVREQSKDNPVFYVQYAHARCCSVLRHAAEMMPDAALGGPDIAAVADTRLIDSADELDLVRMIGAWPRTVEAAAEAHEPHRIAFYLYDLASAFHQVWNRGKEDARLRFLHEGDRPRTLAKLALVKAVALVIASGLEVMGVEPVEEMR